jgi:hypothetical protein
MGHGLAGLADVHNNATHHFRDFFDLQIQTKHKWAQNIH